MSMKKITRAEKSFRDAFVDLIPTTPLEKITVALIVEKSGYSRSAFYKLYETRDDFFKAVVDMEIDTVAGLSRQAYNNPAHALDLHDSYPTQATLALFEYIYQNRALYRFIFSNYDYFNTVDYFFKGRRTHNPHYRIQFSDSLPDIDPELYMQFSLSVQKAAIEYWIEHDFAMSPRYMATQCALFHLKSAQIITLDENVKG